MKRLLSILLAFALLLAFSACSAPPDRNYTSYTESTLTDASATAEPTEEVVFAGQWVNVDIGVNEDGYYGLAGPVELTYYDGELMSVYVDDPALMYFAVSSAMDGGVYLFKQSEGNAIIDDLTAVSEELKAAGHSELGAKIDAIIDSFTNGGPIEGAST